MMDKADGLEMEFNSISLMLINDGIDFHGCEEWRALTWDQIHNIELIRYRTQSCEFDEDNHTYYLGPK